MSRDLLRDERGFTFTELLVTMMIMTAVMFALYSIFDISIRVFSFGNDKVEAVENARLGLERMQREVRAAYPQDKLGDNDDGTLLRTGSDCDTISFGLDVNGNRVVDDPAEVVTYERDVAARTLMRNGQAAVEFVNNPEFGYFDELGNSLTCSDYASVSTAQVVRVTLAVNKDRRTQTLTTDVALRNAVG